MSIVVFSFGRLNPPSIGHQKLVKVMRVVADKLNAVPKLYLSHSHDAKDNPLPYDYKLELCKKAFGDDLVVESDAKTIFNVVDELQQQFSQLVMVVGDDRVEEFKETFKKYYNNIKIVSAGHRDPESEGIEGVSASSMRQMARDGDMRGFISNLPSALQNDGKAVYDAVRGVNEDTQLNELNNNPYPLETITAYPTKVIRAFTTDSGIEYYVGITAEKLHDNTYRVEVAFKDASNDTTDTTGTGNAFRILASVTQALQQYLEFTTLDVAYITFSGKESDGSRIKLYNAIAYNINKYIQGCKFTSKESDGEFMHYFFDYIVENDMTNEEYAHKELNVYYHDELNPHLFKDDHMIPEVRSKLLAIADDFKKSIGVTLDGLTDIQISGSNAAYSYTDKSDIDVHLIVDLPDSESYALFRELFDSKKFQYNSLHNYKIKGYDVELYVQDSSDPVVSQGVYSLLTDEWLEYPQKKDFGYDEVSTLSKYYLLKSLVLKAMQTKDLKLADQLRATIKKYRQIGLAANGEFGPENLAFKALRANGYIKDLYDLLNSLKDKELSVETVTEANMSPGALGDFSKSPIAQSMKFGFEAEVLVPGLQTTGNPEEDFEQDEKVDNTDLSSIVTSVRDFFETRNSPDEIEQALSTARDLLNDFVEGEIEHEIQIADDELYDLLSGMMRYASDDDIENEIADHGQYYERAIQQLRSDKFNDWDNYPAFLRQEDLTTMYDWSKRFNLNWPKFKNLVTGDFTIHDIAMEFEKDMGVPTQSSNEYATVTRTSKDWIFEPDESIAPGENTNMSGLEIISPPMQLSVGLEKFDQFFKWVETKGIQTNSSTGFHVGVSVPGQTSDNVDYVKLILLLGDQHVLRQFGRLGNQYTKSSLGLIQNKIKELVKTSPEDITKYFDNIKSGLNMAAAKLIEKGVLNIDEKKYVSVNYKPKYVEFRSAGGDYISRRDDLKNTILRYVRAMASASDVNMDRQEYLKKLYKLLSENSSAGNEDVIRLFSMFSSGSLSKGDLKSRISATRKPKVRNDIWVLKSKTTGEILTKLVGADKKEAAKKADIYVMKTLKNPAYNWRTEYTLEQA